MDIINSNELQLAFEFVQYTNRNIFLTGKAGTGKTTFLRDLKKLSPKRQVIVAPTGVAAINAGGVTIHSFFQLPFHPFIPVLYLPDNWNAKRAVQDDTAGYKMSREKINIIKSLDLLVIDEISMVRADTLDAIDSALRRYKVQNLPFGGVQLLMIGDLQQLAPVVKDDDREILSAYYDSYFFFGSRALSKADYLTIELKHIFRQTDQTFINLLNKIRDNHVDNEVFKELNARHIPGFDPDSGGGYITLTTHNIQARAINESKLSQLPSVPHSFMAIVRDEFPELSYPGDAELILKKGAQVMFVKNDLSPEKLFFNGKIGKVEAFEEDTIVVRCPGDDFAIHVERAVWQNMKYTLDEETKELDETVIGTFTQYPLRLAWAITIHKSQGLTFDRAVIDAKSAFAHGQVYVALSRCRTLEGIVLSSRIDQRSIIDNTVVSEFIKESVQKQPGKVELATSRKAYQLQLLTDLFSFKTLTGRLSYCIKSMDEHSGSLLGNPRESFEKLLAGLKTDITEVSEKFQLQLKELIDGTADAEENVLLQERIRKGAIFFSERLENNMNEVLVGYKVETDSRIARKSVNDAVEQLRKATVVKLACLKAVRSGFNTGKYLNERAKAEIEIPSVRKGAAKHEGEINAVVKHPVLFSRLKEWRSKKAAETKLPHYRIMRQKALVTLSNELPGSLVLLKKIKGMGKKSTEKYGMELLELLSEYCSSEKIPARSEPEEAAEKTAKKKSDTKILSYELFLGGNTISQIAEKRKLAPSTVENHLAHFVCTGLIPVRVLVSQELIDLISVHFEDDAELKMGPVKELLGEKVSWADIRFVKSHLVFTRNRK